jgi:hypothetical protein
MKVVFSRQEALEILAKHASETFQQSFSPSDVELQTGGSPGRPAAGRRAGKKAGKRTKAANGRRRPRNGRRKAARARRRAANGRRRRRTPAAAKVAATPRRRGRPRKAKARRGRPAKAAVEAAT